MVLFDNLELPDFFDIVSWKIILILIVICILRAWLKGAQFRGKESAKNMVVVITGTNVGIGKQIARDLNYRGAKIHLLCRSKEKGREGLSHLIHLGCHSERLKLHEVDLASFKSVQKFADELKKEETKVDILVNNAGIMLYPKFQLTEDGHELTWQTNYLGHFLLCELLLPLLEEAPGGGRVVNVSALAHAYADSLDLAAVDRREAFDPRQAYARSKMAQIMQAREWTKRLRGRGSAVTINACHPGICYTRLIRHTPLMSSPVLRYTLAPLAWFFLKTPKDGAQTPLFLAISKQLSGVSGKYYSELSEKEPSEQCLNDEACKELYEYSKVTCGLTEEPNLE